MPMNYMPRVFYKGGSSSGNGKVQEKIAALDRQIEELAKDWRELGEEKDLGTWVDDYVEEMNQFLDTMKEYLEDDNRLNATGVYSFNRNSTNEYQVYKLVNGYLMNTGDYQNVHIAQTLDLHSITMTRQGLVNFLKYHQTVSSYPNPKSNLEYARENRANPRTALVRDERGNLKVMRKGGYKNNKVFADELRRNGYKVLNVWKGKKSDYYIDNWEMLHRK